MNELAMTATNRLAVNTVYNTGDETYIGGLIEVI
jgi:hypothetical protein